MQAIVVLTKGADGQLRIVPPMETVYRDADGNTFTLAMKWCQDKGKWLWERTRVHVLQAEICVS